MEEPELYWTGASGKRYGYWCEELPYSCDPSQEGNYIFVKVVDDEWIPVYIGQGKISDRVNEEAHSSCAIGKGATHVHVHTNPVEKDRIEEKQDLLARHTIAYSPTGCNERGGG